VKESLSKAGYGVIDLSFVEALVYLFRLATYWIYLGTVELFLFVFGQVRP